MKKNNTKIENKTESISWSFKEYIKYNRSKSWYIVASVVGIIIIIHAVITANLLFALIIVMVGIIMLINQHNHPAEMKFKISHSGVEINSKKYSFNEINKFWIIYQPPEVKNLYFTFKSSLTPRLSIPLEKQNPLKIRKFLKQYLEEDLDQEYEPASEAIGRMFKL